MIHAVLLAALIAYVPPREMSAELEPHLEERVQKLAKALRCAVCQGVSVADSPASMAQAQLETIRDLVREGRSDEEVREYFIARYGEWVLLEPPRHGFNWIVWLAPLAAVALGGYFVARTVRTRPKPATGPAPSTGPLPPPAPPVAEEDPYLKRVREELER